MPADGNIGPHGQRRRRVLGAMNLAIALALEIALERMGAGRWWRLLLFPILWIAALGFLQARARTCVVFAAQGVCEVPAGRRSPLDAETAAALKQRAKGIALVAGLLAATVTALVIATAR